MAQVAVIPLMAKTTTMSVNVLRTGRQLRQMRRRRCGVFLRRPEFLPQLAAIRSSYGLWIWSEVVSCKSNVLLCDHIIDWYCTLSGQNTLSLCFQKYWRNCHPPHAVGSTLPVASCLPSMLHHCLQNSRKHAPSSVSMRFTVTLTCTFVRSRIIRFPSLVQVLRTSKQWRESSVHSTSLHPSPSMRLSSDANYSLKCSSGNEIKRKEPTLVPLFLGTISRPSISSREILLHSRRLLGVSTSLIRC